LKNIIIFIQAPADVKYALQHYLDNRDNYRIIFIIVNVTSIAHYIKSLLLKNTEVITVPYIMISYMNALSWMKAKKYINRIFRDIMRKYSNVDCIYFYSRTYDYITFSLVQRLLHNCAIIIYYNHYDDQTMMNLKNDASIKSKILIILFNLILQLQVVILHNGISKVLIYRYDNNIVHKVTPSTSEKRIIFKNIKNKYGYSVYTTSVKNALLLFSKGDELLSKHFNELTIELISFLKEQDYRLFIKGHPRMGYPEIFRDNIDIRIDPNIPGELIKIDDRFIIIGLSSATLGYLGQQYKNVFSLLRYYKILDEKILIKNINYMNSYTDNITYPSSINDLVKYL